MTENEIESNTYISRTLKVSSLYKYDNPITTYINSSKLIPIDSDTHHPIAYVSNSY